MSILPVARPALRRSQAEAILRYHCVDLQYPALLGVRGYFLRSIGDPAKNDIGKYDDAIFVVTPTAFVGYNANCDPSLHRARIAHLKEGVWLYKVGTHGWSKPKHLRYKALVQADEVTVDRENVTADDTGFFGINIHRGGETGTSSLGCQTIPPSQWYSFIELVQAELRRHGRPTIPYCLVSNEHGQIA